MTTSTTPVFIANCLYCGRFMSWPYPPVGLEWHHECEAIELRREFERDALLEWHHECEAIELRREFERDALLEWHHECEAIELRREFERDAL